MSHTGTVLAAIEAGAGTIHEVADQSGLEVSRVQEIVDFLKDFGLVRSQGSRIVVDPELLSL